MKKTVIISLFCAAVFGLFFRGRQIDRELKLEELNMLTGFGLETAKAVSASHGYRIPTSVIMAQAILESGWGTSKAARIYKAFFGWKTGNDWLGKTGRNGDGACRAYDDATASYIDHARSLATYGRYSACFETRGLTKKTRARKWAKCLQESGYCPSPDYDDKLIAIIETYNLTQYDK